MLTALRTRLTYANVIASIALFVALGGTGYAAIKLPKNSVGGKQLKANSVTDKKVRNKSLSAGDFKPGQVLTPGAAGGRFLEEGDAGRFLEKSAAGGFLGKGDKAASAGNADTVGGQGAGSFVQGGGRRIGQTAGGFANPGGDTVSNIAIPGFGTLRLGCHGASYDIAFQDSGGGAVVWQRREQGTITTPPTRGDVPSAGQRTIGNPGASNVANDTINELSDVHILKNGKTAVLQIFSQHQRNATGSPQHASCNASVAGVIAG